VAHGDGELAKRDGSVDIVTQDDDVIVAKAVEFAEWDGSH
jgi:hypothetical protein